MQSRGDASIIRIVIVAVVLLATALLVIVMFRGQLTKGTDSLNEGLSSAKDFDGDSVMDAFDKCICLAGKAETGCPGEVPIGKKQFCGCEKSDESFELAKRLGRFADKDELRNLCSEAES
jgi:hypothetical protein